MKNVLFAIFIFSFTSLFGKFVPSEYQEVNRLHLGVQVGFPSLTGVELTYTLPFKGNRFDLVGNVGYLPINISQTKTVFQYQGLDFNGYFKSQSHGFYGGLGYGTMPIKTTRINEETVDYKARFQAYNSHLGFRSGKNVYIRLELGYSIVLYDLEAANEYLYQSYGIRINPTIDFLQFMNGKFGVGFSF